MTFQFKQKRLHPAAKLITQGTPGAAGFDCYAVEDGFLNPLSRMKIPLGFASDFSVGWAALLFDRSGMGNKGITRMAGVIDADYRGEWAAILYNSNPARFEWKAGDRIIQVLFVQVGFVVPEWVEELSVSGRGEGGYGSTGGTGDVHNS